MEESGSRTSTGSSLPTTSSVGDAGTTSGPIASNRADFEFFVDQLPDDELRVLRFSGREAISQPFSFEVELVSLNRDISPAAVVGRAARLRLRGRTGERLVHGVIERFEQLAAGRRFSLYAATLAPTIVPLRYTRNSRIFQQLPTPEIVRRVLADAGFGADRLVAKLVETYAPRDYCVQYQESDLEFISRLLEEEGILYYFAHEAQGDVLVLADRNDVLEPIPAGTSVRFRDESLETPLEEEAFLRFQARAEMRPAIATLNDYRFKQPRIDLLAREASDGATEMYHYPGEYVTPELGRRLARVRLEAQRYGLERTVGVGTCRGLMAGYRFTLAGHPRAELDREYLLASIAHQGSQPQSLGEEHGIGQVRERAYRCEVMCTSIDVPYRPERVTARPRVGGLQTAVVVGPPGEEIHVDRHGRVKVQFHWDREGVRDEHSSCWVRVTQPWAGQGYGALFLPRVGQEVVVQFLEGDPDRPMIIGRVFNGDEPPPYALPEHRSRSTIRSSSTPGGGGYNELRFEDQAGEEEVHLRAQKDWSIKVLHDKRQQVGRNEATVVGEHRSRAVGGDERLEVAGDRTRSVGGNEAVTIGGNAVEQVGGTGRIEVQGPLTIVSASEIVLQVGGSTMVIGPEGIQTSAPTITTASTGEHRIQGSKIKLN